jgi:hypothetical protein
MLGVPVRKVVIAVDAGRNLAVLVEAAVRNTILQLRGIDTYKEFIAAIRRRWVPSRRMLDRAAVLALRLHAVGVQGQRMVLQLEAVLLGDGALACSISASKNSSTRPQVRHTRWSWCGPR